MGAALGATERIAWLDVAKGLCIAGVVLFHAHLYAFSFGFEPAYTGQINLFLQPIRMPLFFAVSGILAASALARPWPAMLGGKVWPLLYLFAVWGLIRWVIFGQLIDNPRTPEEGDDWMQLLAMWASPSSTLWYIWALAIFCIVAKAVGRFRTPALVAAFGLAVITLGGLVPSSPTTYRLSVYLFFFLAGAWHGQLLLAWAQSRPTLIGSAALAGFTVLEFLVLPGLEPGLVLGLLYALQSVLGVALGCAVSVLLSRMSGARAVLGYLGRRTLSIYVTHVIVVIAVAHVLGAGAGQEGWRYAIVPLLVAVGIVVPLLLEAALNRLGFPWLYRAPRLPVAQRQATAG